MALEQRFSSCDRRTNRGRAVRRRHCVSQFRSAAARRSKKIGGGAARRGRPKTFFSKIHEKFRSILKIFLGTFLVIKSLRFADDQC